MNLRLNGVQHPNRLVGLLYAVAVLIFLKHPSDQVTLPVCTPFSGF